MPEFNKPSCPRCNEKDPVRYDKKERQWYCWAKIGGCGKRWAPGTPATAAAATVATPPWGVPPPATAPVISEPQKTGPEYHERSDGVSDRERQNSIMRQTALKAAVKAICSDQEFYSVTGGDQGIGQILAVAERFNDWLHGKTIPVAEQKAQSSEQRAAQTALQTGRPYSAALKDGESLAAATQRALAEHDALDGYDDPNPPHPAETWSGPSNRTPSPRETLRASGPARR